jgi:hypothetical protein
MQSMHNGRSVMSAVISAAFSGKLLSL